MANQTNQSFNTKRVVLVVEDEMINRELLSMILEEEYDVLQAEDGAQALDIIREKKDSLSAVLSDLKMPVMDGFQLLRTLKADEALRQIPVIVLTSEESAEVTTLKMGAVDFIKKPYDMPEVILARVGRIIEMAESRSIIRSAERDELTELYAPGFFYQYVEQIQRLNPDLAMDSLALNIDNFHLVNEVNGRAFGDRVLRKIADIIREFLSDTQGLAARGEGDNFFICCAHREDYEPLLAKLTEGMAELAENQFIRLRAGVYSLVSRELGAMRQTDQARTACNTIRGNYSKSIALYDDALHEKELLSGRLINDIYDALEQKQFQVYFQPKYAIQGERYVLQAAEALIRWKHPELGMVSPGAFVPLFENNGLIQMVDHFVWEETARQIGMWKRELGYSPIVSVNVSRIDIYDPNLESELLRMLEENGLTTADMHLEITESAYAEDPNQLIEIANRLRALGFAIEMDDFGSGYSSLNMLTDLPIDALKLDMKFIRNAHEGNKSFRMIELVMDIAKYLDVPTIAEGVENDEQVQLLKGVGCDLIQGYYFSRPVPPEEFETFIKEEISHADH